MQDLVYMATEGTYTIPPCVRIYICANVLLISSDDNEIIQFQEASEEYLQRGGVKFSFILYHRWLLRFLVNRALFTRSSKQGLVNM